MRKERKKQKPEYASKTFTFFLSLVDRKFDHFLNHIIFKWLLFFHKFFFQFFSPPLADNEKIGNEYCCC